eukprot:2081929-Alexandrium_andersonii.AAC.1
MGMEVGGRGCAAGIQHRCLGACGCAPGVRRSPSWAKITVVDVGLTARSRFRLSWEGSLAEGWLAWEEAWRRIRSSASRV